MTKFAVVVGLILCIVAVNAQQSRRNNWVYGDKDCLDIISLSSYSVEPGDATCVPVDCAQNDQDSTLYYKTTCTADIPTYPPTFVATSGSRFDTCNSSVLLYAAKPNVCALIATSSSHAIFSDCSTDGQFTLTIYEDSNCTTSSLSLPLSSECAPGAESFMIAQCPSTPSTGPMSEPVPLLVTEPSGATQPVTRSQPLSSAANKNNVVAVVLGFAVVLPYAVAYAVL